MKLTILARRTPHIWHSVAKRCTEFWKIHLYPKICNRTIATSSINQWHIIIDTDTLSLYPRIVESRYIFNNQWFRAARLYPAISAPIKLRGGPRSRVARSFSLVIGVARDTRRHRHSDERNERNRGPERISWFSSFLPNRVMRYSCTRVETRGRGIVGAFRSPIKSSSMRKPLSTFHVDISRRANAKERYFRPR